MNAKELAAQLNGRQYTKEITKEEAELAKQYGLVVAFGASDDLIEFRGAIYDEAGVYDGGEVSIVNGEIVDKEVFAHEKTVLTKYRHPFPPTRIVKALWCQDNLETSWLIETQDGEPFDIKEEDNLYCRGVVFKL